MTHRAITSAGVLDQGLHVLLFKFPSRTPVLWASVWPAPHPSHVQHHCGAWVRWHIPAAGAPGRGLALIEWTCTGKLWLMTAICTNVFFSFNSFEEYITFYSTWNYLQVNIFFKMFHQHWQRTHARGACLYEKKNWIYFMYVCMYFKDWVHFKFPYPFPFADMVLHFRSGLLLDYYW